LDRFTGNRKISLNSNKYGKGMDIKETKIQIGLEKDGGRNYFTNTAVKRTGGKYLNGWTIRETDCENANWIQ